MKCGKIENEIPMVSVVMPVYNSEGYLEIALESIVAQTVCDWEMLVINEYGSNSTTSSIIKKYVQKDSRINLIQNEKKLGLADSLNKGMRLAKGKYIARMDADDISHPMRFEKQIELLESNPQIGLCGTYQHHFGKEVNWIHKPPISNEECKANLIFSCDLCHSTVMFRREQFVENGLFYDKNYLAEDFELWSRAVQKVAFTNIPEVLGEYRWSGDNITKQKKSELARENALIVAHTLYSTLGITVEKEDYVLLEGWHNPFLDEKDRHIRKNMYIRYEKLLRRIYEQNQIKKYYDEKALLNVLAGRWRYARYREPEHAKRNVMSIEDIFNPHYIPDYVLMWKAYRERSVSLKTDVRKLLKYLHR